MPIHVDTSEALSTSMLDRADLREEKTPAGGRYNLAAGV
jgi:hypothetical protein